MLVYYDESPAGAGKTTKAVARMTHKTGKFIFATERIESFDELEPLIRAEATKYGLHPIIKEVSSRKDRPVHVQIGELALKYIDQDHVIVFMTHQALVQGEFDTFAEHGWHMIIDEVPAFIHTDEITTNLSADFFEKHYRLDRISDDERWSVVELTDEGHNLKASDFHADDNFRAMATFHARVVASYQGHNKVVANLVDWKEARDSKTKWAWASLYSLTNLSMFDRVELLGNQFLSSVTTQMVRKFDDASVQWVPMKASQPKGFADRNVTIHYFSERSGSRHLFDSEAGRRTLGKIASHLNDVLPVESSIWSTNDRFKPYMADLKHSYIKPRQAGSNEYRHASHAAMIYSANPSKNIIGLLKIMEVGAEAWTATMEHESILQFVTRTSVRVQTSTDDLHFYVFDRADADYLASYFDRLNYTNPTVVFDDIGLVLPETRQIGRPRVKLTPEEAEAKRVKEREQARERMARKRAAAKVAA